MHDDSIARFRTLVADLDEGMATFGRIRNLVLAAIARLEECDEKEAVEIIERLESVAEDAHLGLVQGFAAVGFRKPGRLKS